MTEPMNRGVEGTRPIEAPGVPAGEGVEGADLAAGLDEDPDAQVNRPDQPGAPEPGERPIAEGHRPQEH